MCYIALSWLELFSTDIFHASIAIIYYYYQRKLNNLIFIYLFGFPGQLQSSLQLEKTQ